ncbi:MAG: thiol-disulfide isomerase/thioredoxin [Planctomycetota bacterium]|jgi:thiol-disulfide isomerase/thioredoxin
MGLADELGSVAVGDHEHGHEQEQQLQSELEGETTDLGGEAGSDDFLHPWARAMYRQGLSFNGNERTRIFLGDGAAGFSDLSDVSGADSPLDGRALVAADFDDDMDVDFFVHNIQRERHNLFRNDLDGGGALKVRLRATSGQYEAIGAVVEVRAGGLRCAQVLTRGGGFASSQAPELLFGLGKLPAVRVSVRWPWGELESFGLVSAGARVLLVQGAGQAENFEARRAPLPDAWPDGLKLGQGQVAPRLILQDAAGARVELDLAAAAKRAGGEVWLCFWASYCRPCVAELPLLEELSRRDELGIIAISVDVLGDRPRAEELLERAGASFPAYYLDFDDETNAGALDDLIDLLRLPIPTAIQIDQEGRIRAVLQGPLPKDLPTLTEAPEAPR